MSRPRYTDFSLVRQNWTYATSTNLVTFSTKEVGDTAFITSLGLKHEDSAVNYPQFTASATGNSVVLEPVGTDTNINLILKAKGTGTVTAGDNNSCQFIATGTVGGGTASALSFAAVTGYDTTTGLRKLTVADADAGATARDVWFVPNQVATGVAGYGYKSGVIRAVNTNAGTVGDPVYLSGTAGGWTLTPPTGTSAVVQIGTIAVKSETAGVISVDIGGGEIVVHDHSDNSQGGSLSAQLASTGTTSTTFNVNSAGAAAEVTIDTNSATGAFTQSWSPGNLTANQRITFPDAAAGASVAYVSGKQTVTCLGSTSGGIVLSPTATGTNNFTIANQSCSTAMTMTLPSYTAGTWYFAKTTSSDGSVATTDATGTTAASFEVESDSATGSITILPVAGATDHTLNLSNSTLTEDVTITFPSTTGTVGLLGLAQTWSATNTFTGAITQTGAVTFGTGTGAVSLNGDVTVATTKNLTLGASSDIIGTSGDGAVNFGSMTGTCSLPTGATSIGGTATLAANKNLLCASGTSALDFVLGSGIFRSPTGANTLGGDVTISGSKTFTTGTGAATLKGSATFDTTKTLTFGSAAGGTAEPILMYSLTAANGSFAIACASGASNSKTTLTNVDCASAAVISLPNATCTLSGLGIAETFSAVKTFTAKPVVAVEDATTDAVTDIFDFTKTASGGAGGAGMGLGITFNLEDATGAEQKASLDIVQTDATQATSDVDFIFSQNIAGAITETFRIDADGGVKIGKTGGSALTPTLTIFSPTTTLGSFKITCADATGGDYALTLTQASQTTGSATVTIPDCAGAAKNLAFGDSTGAIAVANLAAAVQDLIPTATIVGAAEAGHVRAITVTVKDAAGNALAFRSHVRIWISTTEYGAPVAGNSTIGAASTGTTLRVVEAEAEITAVTDAAAGTVVFDLTEPDTTNLYVMCEVGGRVYSSGALAFD